MKPVFRRPPTLPPLPPPPPPSDGMQDIVVTAQRRKESLQRVPIAITVLSQKTLQENNVQSLGDLQYLSPSLSSGSRTSRESLSLNIRGQGQSITGQPSVILYIDEVPLLSNFQGETIGGPGLLYDLEQVEVLKGPQGTLFGRNAVGGAVLVRTALPKNDLGGSLQLGYGNYNNREIDGNINLPIVADKLLLRIAVNGQKRDGFTHVLAEPSHPNGIDTDDRNYYAVRGTLEYRLNDDIRNVTVLSYTAYSNDGAPNLLTGAGGAAAFVFPGIVPLVAQQQALGARTVLPLDVDLKSRGNLLLLTNTSTVDFNNRLTFRNIFGYMRAVQAFGRDADGTAFPILGTQIIPINRTYEQFSEEPQLQLKAFDDRLRLVLGAFYLNQPLPEHYTADAISAFGARADSAIRISQRSQALFGQADYKITGRLTATAGLRETWDRRFRSQLGGSFGSVCVGTLVDCSTPVDTQTKSNALTWTVGLAYELTPRTLLYATSRRGYRAGGSDTTPDLPTYGPEFVRDYEAGVKSTFKLGSVPVRVAAAGYYQNYTDVQVAQNTFQNGVTQLITTNAGKARLWGAEFESTAELTRNVEVGANFDHLSFEPTELGFGVNPTQIEGTRLADRPKWKYGLSARYHVFLSDLEEFAIQARWQWQSRTNLNYTDTLNAPTNDVGPYGLLNLSASWNRVRGSPFDLSLYASNALNKTYVLSGATLLNSVGVSFVQYGEPRMFGARVRYHFGPGSGS